MAERTTLQKHSLTPLLLIIQAGASANRKFRFGLWLQTYGHGKPTNDQHADQDECERVIASIAKEVYDEALTSNK